MRASRETVIGMVERAVDADLSRPERVLLLETLVNDEAAREAAREALSLERGFSDLTQAYDDVPAPALPSSGMAGTVALKSPGALTRLRDWLRPGIGALVGAAATAAVLMAIGPAPAPVTPRLEPLAIAFSQVADTHGWTHDQVVGPGQTVHVVLVEDGADDFHLRLASAAGAMSVEAVHRRKGHPSETRTLSGAAVRYAVLRAPRQGDEVSLRNAGAAPVNIHVAASHEGAVRLERRRAGWPRAVPRQVARSSSP